MAMEITGVVSAPHQLQETQAKLNASTERPAESTLVAVEDVDISAAIQELTQVSLAFNRRLQFSVNDKLDAVVVKVIDKETDKVIKEIPPRELQIVHERIREALGLLFDERI